MYVHIYIYIYIYIYIHTYYKDERGVPRLTLLDSSSHSRPPSRSQAPSEVDASGLPGAPTSWRFVPRLLIPLPVIPHFHPLSL